MSDNSASMRSASHYNLSACPSSLLLSDLDIDQLSLDELEITINDMIASNRNLTLENEIFQNFLNRVDPKILAEVDEEIKKLELRDRKLRRRMMASTDPSASTINMLAKWRTKTEESTNRLSMNENAFRAPGRLLSNRSNTAGLSTVRACLTPPVKANIRIKYELVEKEIEEKGKRFKAHRQYVLRRHAVLSAEVEQLEVALSKVGKERAAYERNVVATGRENITRRITAEKFVSFMENSLRKGDIELCCLKLKTTNRKKQYVALSRILEQRAELAENVGLLDMVILRKAYETNSDKLVEKMDEIAKLKFTVGPVERHTLDFKEILMIQKTELQETVDLIAKRRSSLASIGLDVTRTNGEIVKAKTQLAKLREHMRNHVPIDEMVYLRAKMEIPRVRKEIKIWTRRRKVQLANLKCNSRELKVLNKNCIFSELKKV